MELRWDPTLVFRNPYTSWAAVGGDGQTSKISRSTTVGIDTPQYDKWRINRHVVGKGKCCAVHKCTATPVCILLHYVLAALKRTQ